MKYIPVFLPCMVPAIRRMQKIENAIAEIKAIGRILNISVDHIINKASELKNYYDICDYLRNEYEYISKHGKKRPIPDLPKEEI